MKNKKILFISLGALVAVGALVAAFCLSRPKHHLVILHVNDTHSHFEPVRGGNRDGLGGIIERAAYIDSVRLADGAENVLLLHAGDFSQGTTYFSELGGNMEISAINALQYDVVTLGNHEFDNGLEEMARRFSNLKVPCVCANYDFSSFEVGKYVKPYAIVEKAGLKIGVIGILCDIRSVVSSEIADRIPSFGTQESLQKWADYLKKEAQCDLVIALTHIGYDSGYEGDFTDPSLAAATRNVDLFVGGHSHTFLEQMESAVNLDGKAVPIVQDGCWGLFVGRVDVDL